MSTVLVTGSNGFLGSALVERLLASGKSDIRCLVREGSNRARLEAVAAQSAGRAQIFVGDLSTPEGAACAVDGVDVVFHLAAPMSGTLEEMRHGMITVSQNLLAAVVARPKMPRVVLVSSFGVYGVTELAKGAVVDEHTALETRPELRDTYSRFKLQQDWLFRDTQERYGFPLVVLRPGVIYGPGGGALSARLGLRLPGVFLFLGGNNLLPLSYVDNCADAIALAGEKPEAVGQAYNVHDDYLPTCRAYLKEYRKQVGGLRVLPVPYPLLTLGSDLLARAPGMLRARLPMLTPYRARAAWKGTKFSNLKLKSLGWRPNVSTKDGMRRTFEALRSKAD